MSVRLFFSEALVTLMFFALGVAGYLLSKHGKKVLLHHRAMHSKKVVKLEAASDNSAYSEVLAVRDLKKVTTQQKNAQARRRSKRQARTEEAQPAESVESVTELEGTSVQESNDGTTDEQIAEPTELQAEELTSATIAQQINDEYAEELFMAFVGTSFDAVNVGNWPVPCTLEAPLRVQGARDEEDSEEYTPTIAPPESDGSDVAPQDFNIPSTLCDGSESDVAPQDFNIPSTPEDGSDVAPLDFNIPSTPDDGSDVAPQDFNIPSTPDYGSDVAPQDFNIPSTPEDKIVMPGYMPDSDDVFSGTPTAAPTYTDVPSFTDGHQVFEPVLSADGQQLYTDGLQVFMLACMEVPPETSAPCVDMNVSLSSTGPYFAMPSRACGSIDDIGDNWSVCWDEAFPDAFSAPVTS